ncbi:hypothetical protein ABPG75_005711 [Micractinium tetrahymenae]
MRRCNEAKRAAAVKRAACKPLGAPGGSGVARWVERRCGEQGAQRVPTTLARPSCVCFCCSVSCRVHMPARSWPLDFEDLWAKAPAVLPTTPAYLVFTPPVRLC